MYQLKHLLSVKSIYYTPLSPIELHQESFYPASSIPRTYFSVEEA